MVRAKAPLSERNANATPAKASSSKKSPKATSKASPSQENPSLYDVANQITKTHGKKRTHEEDEEHGAKSDPKSEEGGRKLAPNDLTPQIPGLLFPHAPTAYPARWNCDEIRQKIKTLVSSGEVNVGELQKQIDVTPSSYNEFMKQSGSTGGQHSNTYHRAHFYFLERVEKGEKTPPAKKTKLDKSPDGRDKSKNSDESKAKGNSKDNDNDKYDVDDIKLDGEDKEAVPIYDTCSDLRTKINAHLKLPGKSQAALARVLSRTFLKAGNNKHVTGPQIKSFLDKKGPAGGAGSNVFYASYVYFEKLRIKQNKPKSKKRQEMEEVHGREGMSRDSDSHLTLRFDEVATIDKYGKLEISQR